MSYVVHAGDCLAIDPERLGHTHLITDPPYSEHVHKSAVTMTMGVYGHNDLGFAHLSEGLRDYVAGAARAAERWSLIYTDLQGFSDWESQIGAGEARHVRTVAITTEVGDTDGGVIGAIPWVRWSMPQLTGDRPPSGCELLVTGHAKGRMRWRGPGNLMALDHKCLRGTGKHKTEKPLDQALDLVSWFTDPDDMIFDPCAGSGAIGVACVLLGRHYLGAEIQEHWERAANGRIRDAAAGVLSPRDLERLERWRNSVILRSEGADAFTSLKGATIPPEFKALTKGAL